MATVLIIEDEEAMADLIKFRLEEAGYDVLTAHTAAEGLIKLKEGDKPDVVTLDIFLPDNTGLNILKTLKMDPETYSIPIIILSATNELKSSQNCGAEDFISKPVNFLKLLDLLKICLQKKKI